MSLFGRLACASKALANLREFNFDPKQLLDTYHHALADRNFVTAHGSLRTKIIAKEFANFVIPLRSVPELRALPVDEFEACSHVGRLLRLPRTGTHPLRHLSLILWLFDTWDGFRKKYADVCNVVLSPQGPKADKETRVASHDVQTHQLVQLVGDQKISVSRAAAIVGVDVMTAMVWLTKVGIAVKKRPKLLKDGVRNGIVAALLDGKDKQVIAANYNVSVQSVTRALRTEIGLQQAWTDKRKERASETARKHWLSISSKLPGAGVNVLRAMEPAAFGWLYRNDRTWLRNQIATLPTPLRTNNSNINWGRRDEEIARAIRVVSLELSLLHPSVRIAIPMLCQRLPQLRAKLSALDRMPLTRRALTIAIGKRRVSTSKSFI